MKVSVNWIKSIVEANQCSANLLPDGVDALVKKIGAQLGAVEGVTHLGKEYDNDIVIDIENKMFTHRPDCFGMLGIARELAGIQHLVFRSPKWYLVEKPAVNHKSDDKLLSVRNELPDLVPRFMMQVVKNVKVRRSSIEIARLLAAVGVRPVNSVVDVTNYVMLETAQPIHAWDYDKVKALSGDKAQIIVRKAKKGEKLKLIGGKEITLEGKEVVIATDKHAIGLGGVMGGAETEVDENTKNIILEVGNFDMSATRTTAMHHGLFTDAATRFTKNQSPWQNDRVLARVVDFVINEAGGLPARTIYDVQGKLNPSAEVKVSSDFVNERLGLNLSGGEMAKLLQNVEFEVTAGHPGLDPGSSKKIDSGFRRNDILKIEVPFWRTDIEIPEDIVEEVGRLYGYDKLPKVLPKRDIAPAAPNPKIELKQKIRNILSSAGANEVLTYSFVHGSLLQKTGQNPKNSYHIRNALSPDLQFYRQTQTPSLLDKVHPNIKAGFDSFALFEIGVGHYKGMLDKEKIPAELEQLALVVASKTPQAGLPAGQAGAPYYAAQTFCTYLLKKLGFSEVHYEVPEKATMHDALAYFEPSRSANVFADGQMVGRLGEYTASVQANLKLPKYCAGFELYLPALVAPRGSVYHPLNRFPSLDQDICLRTDVKVSYGDLEAFMKKEIEQVAKQHGYAFNLEPIDIFRRPNDKSHKQTTWRITLSHPERTLTTQEANKLLDGLAAIAKKELKAERV